MTQPVATTTQTVAFDQSALAAWLKAQGLLDRATLTVKALTGGQSNPTYLLSSGALRYVLRKKPPGSLLPSAHAVDREYRVMQALQHSDVPVPKLFAYSEELDVVGTPFYIMEYLDGRVIVDQSLPGLSKTDRASVYQDMNRVIAALHKVDYTKVGLETFGKPGNYFGRQIARWSRQYKEANTQDIPELHALIDWLPENIPAGEQTSIVHGDYRLDNLMFHPTDNKVMAVLDWELSTIGHPLADFSYHCMAWHIPPGTFRGIGGVDVAAIGIPTESEYIHKYCDRTGLATPSDIKTDWNFYLAYNMFRIAAILQGIAKRVEAGTASSEQAKTSGAGARPMAELAWKFAQLA